MKLGKSVDYQIINELEKEKRGIYTGSIGLFTKNKMTFNVPIRTLCINKKSGEGEIGLGSGIVWDSIAEEEYEETKLKGSFLSESNKHFEIIESMLVENKKIFLLNEHLDRMQKTAEYFLFIFDRTKVKKRLSEIVKKLDSEKYKLKISLDKWGVLNHFISPIVIETIEVRVIISDK